jgi:hypothetical protein
MTSDGSRRTQPDSQSSDVPVLPHTRTSTQNTSHAKTKPHLMPLIPVGARPSRAKSVPPSNKHSVMLSQAVLPKHGDGFAAKRKQPVGEVVATAVTHSAPARVEQQETIQSATSVPHNLVDSSVQGLKSESALVPQSSHTEVQPNAQISGAIGDSSLSSSLSSKRKQHAPRRIDSKVPLSEWLAAPAPHNPNRAGSYFEDLFVNLDIIEDRDDR